MSDKDIEYEGTPLTLNMCYKNLKNSLRNPVVVHHNGRDQKPGYLKMTFSMCRNAVNGDRFLEISKLKDSTMSKSKLSEPSKSTVGGSKHLPPLMRVGKEMQEDEMTRALLGTQKKKTKREELIDRKIEHLLDTYKKQDEDIVRKAQEKDQHRH